VVPSRVDIFQSVPEGIGPTSVTSIAWSPTSQRIAFASFTGPIENPQEVVLEPCDRHGRQRSVVLPNIRLRGTDGLTDVSWSADGRIFYRLMEGDSIGRYGNVWPVEVEPDTGRVRGAPSQVTSGQGFSAHGFTQSIDGKRLAFVRERDRDTIRIAELQSGSGRLEKSQPLGGDNWDKWLSGWTHDSRAVILVRILNRSGEFSSRTCERARRSLC
jgi:dipeptidyl aminopeptidase/acylaminoacyl peptidase